MKRTILLLIIIVSIKNIAAQKTVTNFNQVWGGYLNQTRLSNKWGFWAEAQLRTNENFVEDISTSILRVGGTYYLNDNTKLTAGYAYITTHSPANGANISIPEHRPWQQVQWHTKYQKLRLMQWVRLEERYRQRLLNANELDNSFSFNWRARYAFLMQVPLTKKMFDAKGLSFIFNDEVQLNFGKQINYNTFDQNRFFLGLAYHTTKSDNIQFGYMNLFTQLASGNAYRSLHVARVYYFHNLDLRKK
jgi:hypothetical protein